MGDKIGVLVARRSIRLDPRAARFNLVNLALPNTSPATVSRVIRSPGGIKVEIQRRQPRTKPKKSAIEVAGRTVAECEGRVTATTRSGGPKRLTGYKSAVISTGCGLHQSTQRLMQH
jgi:hypothetical protein